MYEVGYHTHFQSASVLTFQSASVLTFQSASVLTIQSASVLTLRLTPLFSFFPSHWHTSRGEKIKLCALHLLSSSSHLLLLFLSPPSPHLSPILLCLFTLLPCYRDLGNALWCCWGEGDRRWCVLRVRSVFVCVCVCVCVCRWEGGVRGREVFRNAPKVSRKSS